MITVTNMCFADAIKLGHGNDNSLGNHGCQRIDDKVKDGLVLSVVWC